MDSGKHARFELLLCFVLRLPPLMKPQVFPRFLIFPVEKKRSAESSANSGRACMVAFVSIWLSRHQAP